jgi:hypothetical protein
MDGGNMIGRPGPWTTEADRAELDAAISALLDCTAEHDENCPICAAGWPPCEPRGRAVQALVDWWERRCLLSKAQFLRALQSRREAA